jgi:hypothetical protein
VTPPVEIKSSDTAATLRFSDPLRNESGEIEHFTVTLDSPSLQASTRVWAYTDAKLLARMFREMADEWRGWTGTKEWASVEGEFSVAGKCDHLGHVAVQLRLRSVDGPEPWSLDTVIRLEVGQLDQLADSACCFFRADF